MYFLSELNSANKASFSGYVPSLHKHFFLQIGEGSSICGVGAFLFDQAIGLALTRQVKAGVWDIPWVYVSPRYRNKGVAAALLGELEKIVRQREGNKLIISYSTDNPFKMQIEALLTGKDFAVPKVLLSFFKFECAAALKLGWVRRYVCKEALEQRTARFGKYEIFRWAELKDKEKEYLKKIKGRLYPDWFCPLNGEAKNDPLLSLGVRYEGELIGYLVTRRVGGDTLHIWRSYLKDQYRGSPVYVTLFSTLLHLQDRAGIRYLMSDIEDNNIRMLKFAIHAFEKKNVEVRRWDFNMANKNL